MIRNYRGTTLIEMLLIISILSIMITIPILNSKSIMRYKERKELREFKNDINYIRNRTIVESTVYSIKIRPDINAYLIYKSGIPPKLIKRKEFTSGIKLNGTGIKDDQVVFSHSGAAKHPGTIYLKDSKENEISITINIATGKVNIKF